MKTTPLLLLLIVCSNVCTAQWRKALSDDARIEQIRNYLTVDRRKFVPPYIFDSMTMTYQKGITGSNVAEGKLAASSISVSEKGATLQISLRRFDLNTKHQKLYTGITLSGQGNEQFVSIVKDGKYQNTLSAGLTFNFFPGFSAGNFELLGHKETRVMLQDLLNAFDAAASSPTQRFNGANQLAFLQQCQQALSQYATLRQQHLSSLEKTNQAAQLPASANDAALIRKAREAEDTLIAMGYLPEGFKSMDETRRNKALSQLSFTETTIRQSNFLQAANKELMQAPWKRYSIHWLTFKPALNVTSQPMIDLSNVDNNYISTYVHQYLSFSLAYNYTVKWFTPQKIQFTISPSISTAILRDFESLTKQTITQFEDINANGTTISRVRFSSSGYNILPVRKTAWSIEIPTVLFWGKRNVGLDLAFRFGQNNILNDNIGGRFGIYVPVEIKDGTPVWIEPIFKVGRLGETKTGANGVKEPLDFWQDNVSVGFNLAVAIPYFKAFKGK